MINVIAVTYSIIKEHARECQSAPCVFYCSKLSFFLKMYKFDFFPDLQIYVNMLLFVPVFHAAAQLHFPFFLSPGGLGNSPTSGIGYIVFIQCTPIPCLLLFGIFLTGKIHFSGAGTKIKWIEIENIFLYKFQVKKCPIFKHKKIRLWLIPEPDRWYSTKLLQFF